MGLTSAYTVFALVLSYPAEIETQNRNAEPSQFIRYRQEQLRSPCTLMRFFTRTLVAWSIPRIDSHNARRYRLHRSLNISARRAFIGNSKTSKS